MDEDKIRVEAERRRQRESERERDMMSVSEGESWKSGRSKGSCVNVVHSMNQIQMQTRGIGSKNPKILRHHTWKLLERKAGRGGILEIGAPPSSEHKSEHQSHHQIVKHVSPSHGRLFRNSARIEV